MTGYNFNLDLSTENFTILLDTEKLYGFFEHTVYGDELGGGLWFDLAGELVDYDGVYELPKEVGKALLNAGYWGSEVTQDLEV
jgi:hypothetical protein